MRHLLLALALGSAWFHNGKLATPAARLGVPQDVTAPVTTITSAPTGATGSNSASISFTANEPATFECKIDAGSYSSCTSPKSYTSLSDGSHTATVRATDLALNVESSPPSATWTVDTTKPVTTISSAPSGVTGNTSATFVFSANETSTFLCTVDLGSASCTSPATFTGLDQGPHTFTVTATDSVGNVEASPPSQAWIIYSNALSMAFAGDDDVVSIGKPSDMNLTVGSSTFTYATWFKRGAAADFERHLGGKATMAGGGQVGVVAGVTADEKIEALAYGGENTNGGNIGGFVHGWHLWSFTITGPSGLLYLDGHQVGTTFAVGSGPWETTASWLIGGNRGSTDVSTDVWYPFSGNIDEVSYWSSAFTAAEHLELFHGGTPTSPYAHSKKATLLHFYRMGDGDTYPTITDRKGSSNGTAQNMSGAGVIVADAPVGLDVLPCVAASGCEQLVADDWDGSSSTWTARVGSNNGTKRGSPVLDYTPNFAGRKSVLYSAAGACTTITGDAIAATDKRTYEILVDDWGSATGKYLFARTDGSFVNLANWFYKITAIAFEASIYTSGAGGIWLGTASTSYTNSDNKPVAITITMDLSVPRFTVYRNGTQIYQDLTSSGSFGTATGLAVGLGCRWNQSSVSTEIFGGKVMEFLRHNTELSSGTVSSRLTQFNSLKGY